MTITRVLTASDRRWIALLEDWVEQLTGLLDVVFSSEPVTGRAADELRQQFASFKQDLRVEVARLATLRRAGDLEGFGETDYAPALEQALADLTLKTNAAPGPEWRHQLYHMQITLNYPLSYVTSPAGPERSSRTAGERQ